LRLPGGTVRLFFSDVEGSTRLVQQLGVEYGGVLGELRWILRVAVADKDGREIDCRADELFAVFGRARDDRGSDNSWRQTSRDLVGDASKLRDLGTYSLRGLDPAERLFQLLTPGLREEFPPLRAESSERPGRRVPDVRLRRSRQPTLEEAAWRVRRLQPEMAAELHVALAELGAELFTAHRATCGAEHLLAEIDRGRLDRPLDKQHEFAVVSQQAQRVGATLQQQILPGLCRRIGGGTSGWTPSAATMTSRDGSPAARSGKRRSFATPGAGRHGTRTKEHMAIWLLILSIVIVLLALGGFGYSRR
jgi:hypothetical protein